MAGGDDADLERPKVGGRQVVHRPTRHRVAAHATNGVVGDSVDSIDADLDVEVVHRRQTPRVGLIDEGAVGRELDADSVATLLRCDGVFD